MSLIAYNPTTEYWLFLEESCGDNKRSNSCIITRGHLPAIPEKEWKLRVELDAIEAVSRTMGDHISVGEAGDVLGVRYAGDDRPPSDFKIKRITARRIRQLVGDGEIKKIVTPGTRARKYCRASVISRAIRECLRRHEVDNLSVTFNEQSRQRVSVIIKGSQSTTLEISV